MNYAKLKALIDTEPSNAPPATDATVLAWLKAGSGLYLRTMIDARDILDAMGAPGGSFLDKLVAIDTDLSVDTALGVGTQAAVRWELKFLTSTGVNVGHPTLRTMLTALASAGKPTGNALDQTTEIDPVLALAPEMSRLEAAEISWPTMDESSELYHVAQARAL